jgi:hypothetical protein
MLTPSRILTLGLHDPEPEAARVRREPDIKARSHNTWHRSIFPPESLRTSSALTTVRKQ